jgi:surface polysaccharide O-acyltransferase-like enzyme
MSNTATIEAPEFTHEKAGRRAVHRILAVLAGVFAIVAITTVTDIALYAAGLFTADGMTDALYAIAAFYRVLYGVLGGYVTARFAPDRPMQHALALGAVGLVLSTAGAVAMWSAGPHWYPLAVIAMSLPCSWAGGWLHTKQFRVR